jgi:hypothetical protein
VAVCLPSPGGLYCLGGYLDPRGGSATISGRADFVLLLVVGWVAATAGRFRRCRVAKINAIKIQLSERAEEGSKRIPMVPLRASDRMPAASEEEAGGHRMRSFYHIA